MWLCVGVHATVRREGSCSACSRRSYCQQRQTDNNTQRIECLSKRLASPCCTCTERVELSAPTPPPPPPTPPPPPYGCTHKDIRICASVGRHVFTYQITFSNIMENGVFSLENWQHCNESHRHSSES
ncbi:unnamed protein product [Ceratitis capitata]|uniref:(Mediterranean fruit fly) hypothetical protein n=1 Tax=Ceratitis capitata TaxID=7213 RepID=A0A811VBC7_CERCA|nr:unnamed protein product [Ceratitis capitata]